MLRPGPNGHRLRRAILAMVAAICALVAPRVSYAAIALQCAEPSEAVFASLLEDVPAGAQAASDADAIDDNGAPMSLAEGASAVAPRPIDGPSDARIEAAKRCQDDLTNDEVHAPSENAPVPELASVMAALVPAPLVLPTAEPPEEPPSL